MLVEQQGKSTAEREGECEAKRIFPMKNSIKRLRSMRPTHLLLPLLLLLVSSPEPTAAARHSRIELTTAAATPEAAAAVASDNLAELQAVVMQPTVVATAAASDETKRTDDGGSNKASDPPSFKNDQSSYVANAGGAGQAGSSKLADGKYKQYLCHCIPATQAANDDDFVIPPDRCQQRSSRHRRRTAIK